MKVRIDFDEQLPVGPEVVYDYFRSPTEWPRLYGAFGEVRDLGGGWIAVPLAGSTPDLEARVTASRPNEHVAWDLRGFFVGRGEINLVSSDAGTRVTGFEEGDAPSLRNDPSLLAAAEQQFQKIWQAGWDRLRLAEAPASNRA